MGKCAITTSKAKGKQHVGLTDSALCFCQQLQIPIIDRLNKSIPWLLQQHQLDCLFVEEKQMLVLHWADGAQMFFHPGTAVPRIKQLKDGKAEMMTQIMGLEFGDTVLDCTMGLANDALVAAFAVGDLGSVTALESSPLIYMTTAYGLQNWSGDSWRLKQAMERITPICINYQQYLSQQAMDCYDIVYFDPMFERPVLQSAGIAPLRREADYAPLTQEILESARAVARKKVVVKHRKGTLRHLQFDAVLGGTYSTLAYGLLYA